MSHVAGISRRVEEDRFWHPTLTKPPPKNFSPGILRVLEQALLRSHEKGITLRAALCFDGTTHISSQAWDRGWGCGYRNFLMACTALYTQDVQPGYFPQLDSPSPPCVRNLQAWIEEAWKKGLDEEGAAQLNRTLVGTRKWIGTVELYVAFLTRGIPSRLVEFDLKSGDPQRITQWVERYFTTPYTNVSTRPQGDGPSNLVDMLQASPVVVTNRMPLILQHAGHSRTIVGYEKRKHGGINLLVFDPSRHIPEDVRNAGLMVHNSSQSQPKKSHFSPTKIIKKIFRLGNNNSPSKDSKKRRASFALGSSDDKEQSTKRVRGGKDGPKEVIVIDDDDDPPQDSDDILSGLRDPLKVVNLFRINLRALQKKSQYQILYFPLDDVLSEEERWMHRIILSERP